MFNVDSDRHKRRHNYGEKVKVFGTTGKIASRADNFEIQKSPKRFQVISNYNREKLFALQLKRKLLDERLQMLIHKFNKAGAGRTRSGNLFSSTTPIPFWKGSTTQYPIRRRQRALAAPTVHVESQHKPPKLALNIFNIPSKPDKIPRAKTEIFKAGPANQRKSSTAKTSQPTFAQTLDLLLQKLEHHFDHQEIVTVSNTTDVSQQFEANIRRLFEF